MSTDDVAESMARWFDELHRQMLRDDVSFYEAASYIAGSALDISMGTPGRTGWVLNQYTQVNPDNMEIAVHTARALSSAVLAIADQLGQNQVAARWQDVAYHWLQLRSLIFGAVAPGRTTPWMRILVQDYELEGRIVTALRTGKAVYDASHDQSVWRRDDWEESVSTEQIIQWFETMCHDERHRLTAGE